MLGLLPLLGEVLGGAAEGPLLVVAAGASVPVSLGGGEPLDPGEDDHRDPTALVVATSGSTAGPKGVLLARSALLASAEATAERLGGPGRWLLALPVQSIGGLQVLMRSVIAGTEPVVLDLPGSFDAAPFAAAAARLATAGGVRRYTSLVPTQLARLLADAAATDALAGFDAVLVGGAATSFSLLDQARAAGIRAITTYGMTETCGGCVYDGVPLRGVRVEAGRPIRIGGAVLARGYRRRPDLTAESFARGWFRTSDLGLSGADGRLEVLGRVDDVVVTGGVNVAPAVVEDALRALPGVADAAVFGREDAEWGQRVVAVVVPAAGATLPPLRTLRAQVAARAGAAGAPRELIVVGALPLLTAGKVDRAVLRTLTGEVWAG